MANIQDPASPPPSLLSSFPQNPEDFDADPRISFSKLSNKFILETDEADGAEYEFDDKLKRWVPVLDDALLAQQSQAYAVQGVDENEPAHAAARKGKKRKEEEYVNGQDDSNTLLPSSKKSKPPPTTTPRERKNTAVYVTSLPLSPPPTVPELARVFSRCGVIAEEIDAKSKPRIKLYTTADGSFKGDALVVYFRAESVALAVQMLDDSELRVGERTAGRMRVAPAEFSYKKVKDEAGGGAATGAGEEAAAAAAVAAKGKAGQQGADRKKIIKKTQKLNNKLADWSSPSPSPSPPPLSSNTGTGTGSGTLLTLKHLFTPASLLADPAAAAEIAADIRDECEKLGRVADVVLFEGDAEGVVQVRFAEGGAAERCVGVMGGRMYDGRKVVAGFE